MSDTNEPTEKLEELIVATREAREMSVTDRTREAFDQLTLVTRRFAADLRAATGADRPRAAS
jgi:hypothetical protein